MLAIAMAVPSLGWIPPTLGCNAERDHAQATQLPTQLATHLLASRRGGPGALESPRSAASKDDRRDSFAARLRSHRLAAGLTQDQLAERAELSLRAIQNLERGDRRPYPDTARRLTAALQLTGEERASFERVARPGPRGRSEVAPLRPTGTPPTNVPLPLTACIGREPELAALAGRTREHRLVTLVGPGGSGKTRLAVQLGLDLVQSGDPSGLFTDGVWLVELDAIDEPGLIPQMVATAVGVYRGARTSAARHTRRRAA